MPERRSPAWMAGAHPDLGRPWRRSRPELLRADACEPSRNPKERAESGHDPAVASKTTAIAH